MQKYLWSTVILMLATSIATYLAATCRDCSKCVRDKNVTVQVKCEKPIKVGNVKPLVLSTQPPPFIIEPIEPIAVEPESPSAPWYSISSHDGRCGGVLRCQEYVPARMPYADELSPAWDFWSMVLSVFDQMLPESKPNDKALSMFLFRNRDFELLEMRESRPRDAEPMKDEPVSDDGSWWKVLTEFMQQILPLPGSELEPVDPRIELPKETTPPVQQEETTPPEATMPPADYHHQHPSCTRYLNGCPAFPPPAYPFERTMPSAVPPPPM